MRAADLTTAAVLIAGGLLVLLGVIEALGSVSATLEAKLGERSGGWHPLRRGLGDDLVDPALVRVVEAAVHAERRQPIEALRARGGREADRHDRR